jgi:hypothetical protein
VVPDFVGTDATRRSSESASDCAGMHTTRTRRMVWRFPRRHVVNEGRTGGVLHGEWIWSHGIRQPIIISPRLIGDARLQDVRPRFLRFRFEGGGNVGTVSAFCLISFPSSNPARLFGAASSTTDFRRTKHTYRKLSDDARKKETVPHRRRD